MATIDMPHATCHHEYRFDLKTIYGALTIHVIGTVGGGLAVSGGQQGYKYPTLIAAHRARVKLKQWLV